MQTIPILSATELISPIIQINGWMDGWMDDLYLNKSIIFGLIAKVLAQNMTQNALSLCTYLYMDFLWKPTDTCQYLN